MAKVFGPCLSLAASGDIGKGVQFVCGKFARKKPRRVAEATAGEKFQQEQFCEAAFYWSYYLSTCVKSEWTAFAYWVGTDVKCSSTVGMLTGYNLWVKMFLKFRKYGHWLEFPEPPGYSRCPAPPGGWPRYAPEED